MTTAEMPVSNIILSVRGKHRRRRESMRDFAARVRADPLQFRYHVIDGNHRYVSFFASSFNISHLL